MLGKRIEEKIKKQTLLPFDAIIDKREEEFSEHYYQEIKKKKRYDFDKDLETIDLKTLKNKDAREVGAE